MRLSLVFLLGAVAAVATPRVSPVPKAQEPVVMHPAVRAVLDTKMEAHALEMTDLVMLVVLLQREDAATAADLIASEPRIGRPLERSDASAGLPPEFFAMQAELTARAGDLSMAARTGTDEDMAESFGRLTGVCVGCHALYLAE